MQTVGREIITGINLSTSRGNALRNKFPIKIKQQGENPKGLRKKDLSVIFTTSLLDIKGHTYRKLLSKQTEESWREIENVIKGEKHMELFEKENERLLAKARDELAQSFRAKLDDLKANHPAGLASDALKQKVGRFKAELYQEYCRVYGSYDESKDDVSNEANDEDWNGTSGVMHSIVPFIADVEEWNRMASESSRHLDEFLSIAVTSLVLFVLDRASDHVCDSWSPTCRGFSTLAMYFYWFVLSVMIARLLVVWRKLGVQISVNSVINLGKNMMSDLHTCYRKLCEVNTHQLTEEAQRLWTELCSWAKIDKWPSLITEAFKQAWTEISALQEEKSD
jgi:hypothetical protein